MGTYQIGIGSEGRTFDLDDLLGEKVQSNSSLLSCKFYINISLLKRKQNSGDSTNLYNY